MFINNFNPVAISLFNFDIRWYSLAYIFGIILGWFYLYLRFLKTSEEKKIFSDYISYLIIGIIIGGRIGYVLIYNLKYYLYNPIEILYLWQGGMSFHGGVIGVIFATLIFFNKSKSKVFYYLDLVSLAAPIGIFLGRISNFINSELVGRTTDVPWSVVFVKIDNLSRHPSQIYEAVFEGLILFYILNFILIKNLKNSGVISSYFLIYYSIFRFFIEFTREPDAQIGLLNYFSVGQIISVISLVLGVTIFFFKYEKN